MCRVTLNEHTYVWYYYTRLVIARCVKRFQVATCSRDHAEVRVENGPVSTKNATATGSGSTSHVANDGKMEKENGKGKRKEKVDGHFDNEARLLSHFVNT